MIQHIMLNTAVSNLSFFIAALQGVSAFSYNQEHVVIQSSETTERIQALVKSKVEALRLEKKVGVKFTNTPLGAKAHGIYWLPFRCGLTINLKEIPESALPFTIAHELSHIKNNDLLMMPAIGLLSSSTSAVISSLFLTNGSILLSLAVGAIAFSFFSQYRERQADKSAASVCSLQEIQGGIDLFQSARQANLIYRNAEELGKIQTSLRKLLISPTGDYRLDVLHPSLNSRIAILKEMSQKVEL